jgi:MFS family permease
LGTSLAVIGAFGHSVVGGLSMAYLAMAVDERNRAAHAAVIEDIETGPVRIFMAMGFLGTVLGILLLAIGLWLAKVPPRWAAPLLGAFLLVAFADSINSCHTSQHLPHNWTTPNSWRPRRLGRNADDVAACQAHSA